jgi:hypothetical protein
LWDLHADRETGATRPTPGQAAGWSRPPAFFFARTVGARAIPGRRQHLSVAVLEPEIF